MKLNSLIPRVEQIKQIGEMLFTEFKNLENTEFTKDGVERKINELMESFMNSNNFDTEGEIDVSYDNTNATSIDDVNIINSTSPDIQNKDNDCSLYALNENYHWIDRMEEIGENVLDEIIKNMKKEKQIEKSSPDAEKRRAIYEKIVHNYNTIGYMYKNRTRFAKDWVDQRTELPVITRKNTNQEQFLTY